MIQITKVVRGYRSNADRKRAKTLLRRYGYDHFVEFVDIKSKYALCYGRYVRVEKLQKQGLLGIPPQLGQLCLFDEPG